MQTSAPPFPSPVLDSCEHTGVLLHAAQVRTKVLDGEGHMVPALCFEIELNNKYRTHMQVEQLFDAGQHTQAQAAAHRLKKGAVVTIQAPLIGLRLIASNTTHIYTHAAPAAQPLETTEPCQTSLL